MTTDDLYQRARNARDPVQVAVDRVTAAAIAADRDAGAPFEADVLEALALLETVPIALARAMSSLKAAKVNVGAIKKALVIHTRARKEKEAANARLNPDAPRSYIMTGKNSVLVCPSNAVIWCIRTKFAKRLRYNAFFTRYEIDGENLTETKAIEITGQMELDLESNRWDRGCFDAALAIMRERKIIPNHHPVREYLEGLKWDGKHRVRRWLIDYLGAVNDSSEYVEAVGEAWMISAIARIFLPGCKADHVLILQGPQGILKSSALGIMAGPWFSDAAMNLESKDALIGLKGAWIVELAELASLNRSAVDSIKAFISRRVDRYRPVYATNAVDQPREFVFAGTVNDAEFLRDETGNRRFWPVEVTNVDEPALVADRDQLWAEAVQMFRDGRQWYLETAKLNAEAVKAQERHTIDDTWFDIVQGYLIGRMSVTARELLVDVLRIEPARISRTDDMRVAKCLQRAGFAKKRVYENGKTIIRYFPA